ncbi:hypothetical protein [Agaribacter marinus]|uniref:Uncharacterized protein n=1 Tax=Agaribacter marinus TaxID=1431249 RepID=A0AA37T3G5_9ALTE|nr:hypothetical protein [Agaribacter marinus]GLR72911.1 hypothetical protein GCM10007852_38190 [Agaribacter marinus]
MKEDPYLLSGRNTIIHKLRKVDLLIVNSRQDPVLMVMHNGIEVYEGSVPKNKLEAKRMDVAVVDISSPDNFGDYKSLLFIQTLNNKEFKVDYSRKASPNHFITIHQESTF